MARNLQSNLRGAAIRVALSSDEAASQARKHLVDLERSEQIYLVTYGKVTLK